MESKEVPIGLEWANVMSPLEHKFFGSTIDANFDEKINSFINGDTDASIRDILKPIALSDRSSEKEMAVTTFRKRGLFTDPVWIFGSTIRDENFRNKSIHYYDPYGLTQDGHTQGFAVELVDRETKKPVEVSVDFLKSYLEGDIGRSMLIKELYKQDRIAIEFKQVPIVDIESKKVGDTVIMECKYTLS